MIQFALLAVVLTSSATPSPEQVDVETFHVAAASAEKNHAQQSERAPVRTKTTATLTANGAIEVHCETEATPQLPPIDAAATSPQ